MTTVKPSRGKEPERTRSLARKRAWWPPSIARSVPSSDSSHWANLSRQGHHFAGVHASVDHHAEERNHHLLPRLRAGIHVLRRIGVAWIVQGIVVVRVHMKPRAFRHRNRRYNVVARLPCKIVPRHAQHDFRFPARIDQAVGHVFPTQMHVRHEPYQLGVDMEKSVHRGTTPIRIAGWDAEDASIRDGQRLRRISDEAPLGLLLPNREPYACYIDGLFAIRRVMHLDHQICVGRDQLPGAMKTIIRRSKTWNIRSHQSTYTGGRDFGNRPTGRVWFDEDCGVMQNARIARQNFDGGDPRVFGKPA